MSLGKNQGEIQQGRHPDGSLRPLNLDEETAGAFYKQLAEVSLSLALALLGGCRRFLDYNLLAQLVSEPNKGWCSAEPEKMAGPRSVLVEVSWSQQLQHDSF